MFNIVFDERVISQDIAQLSGKEEILATKALKRIREGSTVGVEPMKWEGENAFYFKPDGGTRQYDNVDFRVVWKQVGNTMVVLAVSDRANVYSKAGKRRHDYAEHCKIR